jgi:hypothetical protein
MTGRHTRSSMTEHRCTLMVILVDRRTIVRHQTRVTDHMWSWLNSREVLSPGDSNCITEAVIQDKMSFSGEIKLSRASDRTKKKRLRGSLFESKIV